MLSRLHWFSFYEKGLIRLQSMKKRISLAEQNPELAAEWHPTKNKSITPEDVTPYSDEIVWWLGKCGHEWQVSVHNRNKADGFRGCPYCTNKRVMPGFNDLQTLFPELAAEWHPNKNYGLRPEKVFPNKNGKVWWLCKLGHEYEA